MPRSDYPNDNYIPEQRSFRVVGPIVDALLFLSLWGGLIALGVLAAAGKLQ